MIFEKIFQRDDKSFLLFYYSFLSIILLGIEDGFM